MPFGKFKVYKAVEDLPRWEDVEGYPYHENRYMETTPEVKVHATTMKSLSGIMKEGLKPREMSGCEIWPEDRVPEYMIEKQGEEFREKILQCREAGVYFWDDYAEGISQALATVGMLKEGDPLLLVIDVSGLELKKDPEVESDPETDPTAYMVEGAIDKDRIKCICELNKDLRPSVGSLMCPLVHHGKDECPPIEFEKLMEELQDLSNWSCWCKEGKI